MSIFVFAQNRIPNLRYTKFFLHSLVPCFHVGDTSSFYCQELLPDNTIVQICTSKFATEVHLNMHKGYRSRRANVRSDWNSRIEERRTYNITFHQQNFKMQSLKKRSKYRSLHYWPKRWVLRTSYDSILHGYWVMNSAYALSVLNTNFKGRLSDLL